MDCHDCLTAIYYIDLHIGNIVFTMPDINRQPAKVLLPTVGNKIWNVPSATVPGRFLRPSPVCGHYAPRRSALVFASSTSLNPFLSHLVPTILSLAYRYISAPPSLPCPSCQRYQPASISGRLHVPFGNYSVANRCFVHPGAR